MQPDAEHQQDHPDLGELERQSLIDDKSWRERADDDAGEEISHQRRQFEPMGNRAQYEGEAEAEDDRGDEGRLKRHDRMPPEKGSDLCVPYCRGLLSADCAIPDRSFQSSPPCRSERPVRASGRFTSRHYAVFGCAGQLQRPMRSGTLHNAVSPPASLRKPGASFIESTILIAQVAD